MKCLLVYITFLFALSVQGQHVPIIGQYMFNPLPLNPAFTGIDNAFTVSASYRAQWIGMPGAPKTQSLAVHAPLKNLKSAFGVLFFADQIGITNQTGLYGSYSYRLKLKNDYLVFGISGGFAAIRTNYSRLEVNDQIDQALAYDSPRGVLPDFSFGMRYQSKRYFLSFSSPFFLSHTYNGTKYKVINDFTNYNFLFGAGCNFELKNGMWIRPSTLIKYKPNNRVQFDFNTMLEMNEMIEVGLSVRTEESFAFLFKYRMNDQFQMMYSFGIPFSSIANNTLGSHEIGLKYMLLYKTAIKGPRYF